MIEALEHDKKFQAAYRDAKSAADGRIASQIEYDGFEPNRESVRPAGARIERGVFSRYKITDVGEYVLDGGTTHGTSNIVGGRPSQAMIEDRRPVAIVGVYPREFTPNSANLISLSSQWQIPVPVFSISTRGVELYMGSHGPIPYGD